MTAETADFQPITLEVVETGEIVEPMTAEQASSITTQIAVKLDAIADNYESVMPLIREAITRQAHAALGYASPGAYVSERFGHALSRLGVETRRQVVRELTEAGLSTRAIAPIVGVSHKTVVQDRQVVPEVPPAPESSPAPDPLAVKIAAELAASDQTYAAQAASTVEDIADAEIIDDPPAPAPVTGLDGKTYQPTGRKPPRKALVEVAKTRGFALRAATDSLMRLFDDDRYRTNEKQVADVLRGHLLYVAETVTAVIDQLP